MAQDFVETTKEASKGGYQGIKKVRGILTSLTRVPSKFTEGEFGKPKDQIEVALEDAAILEMLKGEDEMELKEGKYTFWVPYAEPQKTPNQNSIYMKVWIASAEAMGKTPTQMIGEYVTLERKKVDLFKTDRDEAKKPLGTDEEGNKIYRYISTNKHFCFVTEESADAPDTVAYIKELVVGKNKTAALRALVMDGRAKQFPEYKESLSNDTLGELLGVKEVDGVFQDAEDKDTKED